MPLSSVLFFTLIYLMPSSLSAADQYVEVTYTCPSSAGSTDINWDNHIQGNYSGTDGKSGNITFIGDGTNVLYVKFDRVSHPGGQKIECHYRGYITPGSGMGGLVGVNPKVS